MKHHCLEPKNFMATLIWKILQMQMFVKMQKNVRKDFEIKMLGE